MEKVTRFFREYPGLLSLLSVICGLIALLTLVGSQPGWTALPVGVLIFFAYVGDEMNQGTPKERALKMATEVLNRNRRNRRRG